MSNIFDQITASTPVSDEHTESVTDRSTKPSSLQEALESQKREQNAHPESETYTPKDIKTTTQELLKFGLLEAERKPNLYKLALTHQASINQILEPLDLHLKIDDIRGLALLIVADQPFSSFSDSDPDEWNHPLIRRQRLNLEQSLLVALLRQMYVAHEQEAGIGASDAIVFLDDLLPQLQLYLGDTGSDAREQKRLRNLLENLRGQGIVSEVDDKDQFIIRPVITHLANPESLQGLLQHFRNLAEQSRESTA